MQRKVYIETVGCQMNVLDSELVVGQLRAQGYESDRRPRRRRRRSSSTPAPSASTPRRKSGRRLGGLRDRKAAEPAPRHRRHRLHGRARRRRHLLKRYPARRHPLRPRRARQARRPGPQRRASPTRQPASTRATRQQVALMGATRPPLQHARSRRGSPRDCSISRRSISPSDDVAPGVRPHHARLRQILHLLRRPLHARPRGASPAAEHHRRSPQARRRRRDGSHAARPDGQHYHYEHGDGRETTFADLLYQIHEAVPDTCRGSSSSPTSRATSPTSPSGHARLPADLPLPARPRPVRLRSRAEADEPRLHRRPVPRLHRPRPRLHARRRASPATSSSASRRDRGGVRADGATSSASAASRTASSSSTRRAPARWRSTLCRRCARGSRNAAQQRRCSRHRKCARREESRR